MAFNFSKGFQIIGDLSGSDDAQRDTGIDFEDNYIALQTSGSVRLEVTDDGVYIPDTAQNASLFVSGGIQLTPGNQEGIRFANKGSNELNFISFQEGTEGGSYNARLSYNSAEYLFIAPGRGGDFFLNVAETSGDGTYPFSIMDDGTAKFTKNLTSHNDRALDLASDIAFYVSGTTDGNNNALFEGNVVMSGALLAEDNVIVDGRIGIGVDSPSYKLEVGGNMSVGQYIYHRNDANTFINFTDNRVRINAGGNNFIDCEDPGSAPHKVRINNGGNNIDFIIKDNSGNVYFTADASTTRIGIGTETPLTRLDVHHDPTNLANDTGGGEVVKFGSGTLTAGKLYYLYSSTWTEVDADAVGTGADQLLGIALGSNPATDGVLIRGFFDANSYLSNFSAGKAVYISTTAGGMDTTAPSGAGDFVRIVGYCTTTANVIYFNPSTTWVEL